MQIHREGARTRLQQNRVEVSIYLLEFFIVFKVKNNKQLYRANATAIKTRTCLHKTLKNFSNDDSENGKNAIALDWQNNNFTQASRVFVH